MSDYLTKRQNAVTTADPAELEAMLGAVARVYQEEWLAKTGDNPLQILWNRKDALATNELLNLGDAVLGLEKSDPEWLKRQASVIKVGDDGNRNGALFELLALNFFRAAGHKVVPAGEKNPGYDGRVEMPDGSSVLVSLKNHGISSHERSLIDQAKVLDTKFQRWLQQRSLNGIEARLLLNDYPSSNDWAALEHDLGHALDNVGKMKSTDIAIRGKWLINLAGMPAEYCPLSGSHLSSSFFLCVKAHKNEQNNFIENIRTGCQNLIKHTIGLPQTNLPMLFVRLSANASMEKCTEWVRNYFEEYPNEPIGVIVLYQPVVATHDGQTSITHYITMVTGPKYRPWTSQADGSVRRLPNMRVAVGLIVRQPSRKVLQGKGISINLEDCYTFQRADIYRYYKVDGIPFSVTLANPAPGVRIHAEVEVGGSIGTIQPIAPLQNDLLLFP
jgi:hypothetical protein